MKKRSDPRHLKRIKLIQELFSLDFNPTQKTSPNLAPLIKNLKKIDATIEKVAPLWPKEQINKIDLSILRLATFELLLAKEPQKVIADEAVELAKQYGSDTSPGFVNGVLGKIING